MFLIFHLTSDWIKRKKPTIDFFALVFYFWFANVISIENHSIHDGRGRKWWNAMTAAAGRKRRRHTQHQHREKKAYASEIMNTDTYFFALSSLNQTECFTWAALFSRIFIYFCFVLLKSHFRLEERKKHDTTLTLNPIDFFSLLFALISAIFNGHTLS